MPYYLSGLGNGIFPNEKKNPYSELKFGRKFPESGTQFPKSEIPLIPFQHLLNQNRSKNKDTGLLIDEKRRQDFKLLLIFSKYPQNFGC